MQFVLKREGIEPKRWDFEPNKLLSVECIEIEKRTGLKFPEWVDAFRSGSMLAIHAFIFVMMKRERPGIKWDDVWFTFDDVDLEIGEDEIQEVRAEIRKRIAEGAATEDDLAVLAEIGDEPEGDEGSEGLEESEDPKA